MINTYYAPTGNDPNINIIKDRLDILEKQMKNIKNCHSYHFNNKNFTLDCLFNGIVYRGSVCKLYEVKINLKCDSVNFLKCKLGDDFLYVADDVCMVIEIKPNQKIETIPNIKYYMDGDNKICIKGKFKINELKIYTL